MTTAAEGVRSADANTQSRWAWLRKHLEISIGGALVALSIVLAIFGPSLTAYDPEASDPFNSLQPPSIAHPFGTDPTGMDVFSRVIAAPRVDVVIALTATIISMGIGIPLGVFAGYFSDRPGIGGWTSEILLRAMDVLQAFPIFVLALGLVAATGPGVVNVIAVVSILNVPVFIRLTRSGVLAVRTSLFIQGARCIGNSEMRIAFRHILPNSLAPALVNGSVTVGWAILLTAGLSFAGAGLRVPTPEWGSMIAVGAQTMITGQWWPSVFPGIALGLTVLGYALFADALKELLDPIGRG